MRCWYRRSAFLAGIVLLVVERLHQVCGIELQVFGRLFLRLVCMISHQRTKDDGGESKRVSTPLSGSFLSAGMNGCSSQWC
ncbi:hypothetical protein BC567DRAFT_223886 [Phyllosticta citribraziliensis]